MSGLPETHNRGLRFTLAALLFLVLFIAGGIAGYRYGYDQGYSSGEQQRSSEELVTKVYPIADFVKPIDTGPFAGQADYDSVIQLIQTMVTPSEWEALGGPCTTSPMLSNETLVVLAFPQMHEQIETLFRDLRQNGRAGSQSSPVTPDE